ncbi:MAG: hypothetical protein HUU47_08705 [Bacteroidetes bacterium]|nr:hypothetical protein [Bacteroidota bacterium]
MGHDLPFTENESEKRIRPLFLTVTCIISYIVSAFILWESINNMGENTEEALSQNALITTIGTVLSIIGTTLMWHCRVFGFWMFFAGTAAIIAGAIVIFGLNYLMKLETGLMVYLSFALLVLFTFNYKYMD